MSAIHTTLNLYCTLILHTFQVRRTIAYYLVNAYIKHIKRVDNKSTNTF